MNERIRELASKAEEYAEFYAAIADEPEKDIFVRMFAELIAAEEREACIQILSSTEFTSLDHMPSEAALIIRARGGK